MFNQFICVAGAMPQNENAAVARLSELVITSVVVVVIVRSSCVLDVAHSHKRGSLSLCRQLCALIDQMVDLASQFVPQSNDVALVRPFVALRLLFNINAHNEHRGIGCRK